MKIAVLNGSPRSKQNTSAIIGAFCDGAEAAGHTCAVLHVGKMRIGGCIGCEYCHNKGNGNCVLKDDFQKVLPAYKECDMIVFASPLYYLGITSKLQAAIERIYCIGKPPKATKAALLLTSAAGAYEGPIAQYKNYAEFAGLEDMGIFTATGDENKSEAKLAELKAFGESL